MSVASVAALVVVTTLGSAALAAAEPAGSADAVASHCPDHDGTVVTQATGIAVPGAEMQKAACLPSLTTGGPDGTAMTGYTQSGDWNGFVASDTALPTGVPGIQVDGYFPDDATQQHNTRNGWNHDAQFVIRFPAAWNGDLVVTGAHGTGGQYNADTAISDWMVARGYAYAATDKGNSEYNFWTDGQVPGDAVAEWHDRVTELTLAAEATVAQVYGAAPAHTWMTGVSNGGYLTRFALENAPELYDGGVDWEGTLFSVDLDGPHLFRYLPVALANYPNYAEGDAEAHQAMIDAGFAEGSEFLWFDSWSTLWDTTQRNFREEFDPTYDGDFTGGVPYCQAGMGVDGCDADYDLASRPADVHDALRRSDIVLTGNVGRPLITIHGAMDTVLPIRNNADVYARMVADAGRAALHRYYVVEDGTHIDGRYDVYPEQIRPILPCYLAAFDAMVAWAVQGTEPAPSGVIERPTEGDLVNGCALPAGGSAGADEQPDGDVDDPAPVNGADRTGQQPGPLPITGPLTPMVPVGVLLLVAGVGLSPMPRR